MFLTFLIICLYIFMFLFLYVIPILVALICLIAFIDGNHRFFAFVGGLPFLIFGLDMWLNPHWLWEKGFIWFAG